MYQNKFLKVVEELKKGEEQRRKLGEKDKTTNEVKASLESELAKMKVENTEL